MLEGQLAGFVLLRQVDESDGLVSHIAEFYVRPNFVGDQKLRLALAEAKYP